VDVALLYSRSLVVTVMDIGWFKFDIYDIISLYKKSDSEVSQPMILPSIFDDIIVNNVIYL